MLKDKNVQKASAQCYTKECSIEDKEAYGDKTYFRNLYWTY